MYVTKLHNRLQQRIVEHKKTPDHSCPDIHASTSVATNHCVLIGHQRGYKSHTQVTLTTHLRQILDFQQFQ
jgi:hypothetical protein